MLLNRPAALIFCALLFLAPGRAARAQQAPQAGDSESVDFKARAGNITATAITPDGKRLLMGEDTGRLALWDVEESGTTPMLVINAYVPHAIFACGFLPGNRAITCGDDNWIKVWDLNTGKIVRQIGTGTSIPYTFECNPAGTVAVAGCNDGRIAAWDIESGKCLAVERRDSPVCGIQFSADGRLLAAGYSDGKTVIWDARKWTAKFTLPDAEKASVGALAFSPDGRFLATGNQNGGGFVWNVSDGSMRCAFAGYANPEEKPNPPMAPVFAGSTVTPPHRTSIVYVAFSPDSALVLGSLQDDTARYWDAKTGKFLGNPPLDPDKQPWFGDNRFYIARYGFTFALGPMTAARDTIVLTRDYNALVFKCPWKPIPPEE